ncbi:MAG TPA: alpha-mannosidase, partial [Clostridiales bacterium]|nr:alpha-mannosidase [Clostridiales bacterium]
MYYLDQRIDRYLQELESLIYPVVLPVAGLEIHQGHLPRGTNPLTVLEDWQPYTQGDPWAMPGAGEYALFRAQIILSDPEMAGKPLAILCRTNKTGWNALNPQFLFYVDGRPQQAFDTNHLAAMLGEVGAPGQEFTLHCAAFGGLVSQENQKSAEPVRFYLDLAVWDKEVWGLYFDLFAPRRHSKRLNPDSAEWAQIVETLNSACNLLDLRAPGSPEFHRSVPRAREYLRKNLYNRPCGALPVTVSCIGHTHIDVAWLQRYDHTREKTARTFATVLALMDEYPDFIFTSSQPQLFSFLKEDFPDLYRRVKERIKEGRLEVEGGMWVESDTNLPSGESLVRQILHGKKFLRDEFGVESRILWLPDVFGYSAALPQILRKSGIDYFMTSKLRNNELNEMPHNTFLWRGIDGTDVLTQLTSYNPSFYNGDAQSCEMIECWRNYKDKHLTDDILYTYGFGDGGGGPTREMVETLRRFDQGLPGAARTRFGKAADFFANLEKRVSRNKRLTTWHGELYYEKHRGTYTSMARNKRNNRKAEFLLTDTEWLASLNHLLTGGAYPSAELDPCWKTLLLNQFHDVLPGSSIKEVYQDTDHLYAQLFQRGGRLLAAAADSIAARIGAAPGSLVVFNPLSWARDTAVFFAAEDGSWALCDGENTFPAQKCHSGGFVTVVRNLPPLGWASMRIVPGKDGADSKNDKSGKNGAPGPTGRKAPTVLENEFVRLQLDRSGNIASLYDKRAGREAFRPGMAGNRLLACEDKPHNEDNWNLDVFYTEKTWDIPARQIELAEQGPVRTVVKITRPFLNSTIVQHLILWNHQARIDFETVIDWKDRDICLKAEFPVDVNAERATYEIQYGHLERPVHTNTSWDEARFEVCAHKWADLSDHGFGLSLLNDCKYGHDTQNGKLRLTLLRSTGYPNPDADKEIHRFTYSILPHAGDWRGAGTVRQAYDLNQPAITAITAAGGTGRAGALPARLSFAGLSAENIILEVVKQAEDGD